MGCGPGRSPYCLLMPAHTHPSQPIYAIMIYLYLQRHPLTSRPLCKVSCRAASPSWDHPRPWVCDRAPVTIISHLIYPIHAVAITRVGLSAVRSLSLPLLVGRPHFSQSFFTPSQLLPHLNTGSDPSGPALAVDYSSLPLSSSLISSQISTPFPYGSPSSPTVYSDTHPLHSGHHTFQ